MITEKEMISRLKLAEIAIEEGLADPMTRWNSFFVGTELPHVEWIWVEMDDGFLALVNRILPIPNGMTSFFHNHRRPNAFIIRDGVCKSEIGHGRPDGPPPPVTETAIYLPGEPHVIVSPGTWHSLTPTRRPVISVNAIGPVYRDAVPLASTRHHPPLPPDRTQQLLAEARILHGIPC